MPDPSTPRHPPETRATPALEGHPGWEVRQEFFEGLYRDRAEPWDYSRNAAELLRHDLLVRAARSFTAGEPGARILDVGCSLGQLTSRFAPLGVKVHAVDLSPTAAREARARALAAAREVASTPGGSPSSFHFAAANGSELPFRDATFDVLLLCDGLVTWRLTPEEAQAVLRRAAQVVKPGGRVILTEALKPRQIAPFVDQVRSSPLRLESVRFLHDRLWFSVERALRPHRHRRLAGRALASRPLAGALSLLSRLAGSRGSKHVFVVARRPAEGESA
jgi:SAM-dependent methyltransferase